MKKEIFAVLLGCLSLSFNARADVPADWSDIRGCYDAVQYNGHPVGTGDPGLGKSYVNYAGPEGLILNPNGARPQSVDLDLVKSVEGNRSDMDMAIILQGQGTFSSSLDGKSRSWEFNGPMLYAVSTPPTPFTYIAKVDVTDLGSGSLLVHNYRHIPEMPDHSMDADDTYLLKLNLNNCYLSQCTDNGDGTSDCWSKPYPPAILSR